jgi:hypothetical protein
MALLLPPPTRSRPGNAQPTHAQREPAERLELAAAQLPDVLTQAQDAYSVLAADTLACVTDVVSLRRTGQDKTASDGQPGLSSTSGAPHQPRDAAGRLEVPEQLNGTFEFLKQLVPKTL